MKEGNDENLDLPQKIDLVLKFFQDAYPIFESIRNLESVISEHLGAEAYFGSTNTNVRGIFRLFNSELSIEEVKSEIHIQKKELNEIVIEGFTILQYSVIGKIDDCKDECNIEQLKHVYENFYAKENHHHQVETIKKLVHSYSKHKNSTYIFEVPDAISRMWTRVYFLIDVYDRFNSLMPAIRKSNEDAKKKAKRNTYWQILLAVIPALIAGFFAWLGLK